MESGVDRIRVATANMSRLLADMVRQGLTADHEIDLVAELTDADALQADLNRDSVNVLILGIEEGGFPAAYATLMAARPGLRVLGLSTDARQTYAYELRPHCTPLGEASPTTLAAAVRAVARAGVT
jgi:DNA-binding NarL/FixJ family response regulator